MGGAAVEVFAAAVGLATGFGVVRTTGAAGVLTGAVTGAVFVLDAGAAETVVPVCHICGSVSAFILT